MALRRLHGVGIAGESADNVGGLLPEVFRQAGLTSAPLDAVDIIEGYVGEGYGKYNEQGLGTAAVNDLSGTVVVCNNNKIIIIKK